VDEVISQNKIFGVESQHKIQTITGGFGNILAWSDTPLYERDLNNLRKVLNPDDIQRIRKFAFATANDLIDTTHKKFRAEYGLDVVTGVAKILPGLVLSNYLGLSISKDPKERLVSIDDLSEWLEAIYRWIFFDNDPVISVVLGEQATKAAGNLAHYIADLLPRRRKGTLTADKQGDLIGRYLNLQLKSKDPPKDGLDDRVITSILMGHAISVYTPILLLTTSVLEFLLQPANRHILEGFIKEKDDRILEKFMLEATRFANPLPPFHRTPNSDYVINRGKVEEKLVKSGQLVIANASEAMSDPATFPAPVQFKLDRPEESYLTFPRDFYSRLVQQHSLAVVAAVLKALTVKPGLKQAQAVSYITPQYLEAPFPQSFLVRYLI